MSGKSEKDTCLERTVNEQRISTSGQKPRESVEGNT